MTSSNDYSHINISPDVLIIGAGAAGVAAATGALQGGASVLVVEKNSYPGGKATAAFVGTICGLYYTALETEPRYVVNGFPKTFGERLMKLSNTQPQFQNGGLHFFPYQRDVFISLCNEYVQPANVCLHSYVESIRLRENDIYEVVIERHNHPVVVYPKQVIDCSGDALSSLLTNCKPISSEYYQAAAQVFMIGGLLANDGTTLSLSVTRNIKKGIEQNLLPRNYERLSVVPGTYRNGSALFKLGIPHSIDHTAKRVAEIELFAKEAVHKIHDFLKNSNDFFANSFIEFIAPEAGIRTGPRCEGKYILNENDVLSCRKFDDAIARGSWPIELWEPGKNVEMRYFRENDFYHIPSGCLISSSINNLFFAGRTISATEDAIASARVIGTCLQTGFAAGMLAAGAAKSISINKTIEIIQHELFVE